MSGPHILVVGAGIAGSICAYWLGRANIKVTVIERSSKLPKYGQGIDAEGPARKILDRMGLVEEMKKRSTGEEGFGVCDDDGKLIGSIAGGLTSDIEIMRGDLCELLYDAATSMKSVEYVFGKKIVEIKQEEDKVVVKYEDGAEAEYTAVVGADGLRSQTRQMAFNVRDTKDCFKARDQYAAYFTIPYDESDWPLSRAQNATNGRTCLIRPCNKQVSSGYLMELGKNDKLAEACLQDRQSKKEAVRDLFEGVGGIVPRVVEGMMGSEDFYMEQLAQIKLKKWYNGRVVLAGDAGYAPSPVTGSGTLLAIVGAYHLAGELSESPDDPEAAFAAYDMRLRPYIERMQIIPLWDYAPRIVNPATTWGIWALRTFFSWFAWSELWKKFDTPKNDPFELPEYHKLEMKR